MAGLGQTAPRHQTHVSTANHRDFHDQTPFKYIFIEYLISVQIIFYKFFNSTKQRYLRLLHAHDSPEEQDAKSARGRLRECRIPRSHQRQAPLAQDFLRNSQPADQAGYTRRKNFIRVVAANYASSQLK
jgi:hypothetical protein